MGFILEAVKNKNKTKIIAVTIEWTDWRDSTISSEYNMLVVNSLNYKLEACERDLGCNDLGHFYYFNDLSTPKTVLERAKDSTTCATAHRVSKSYSVSDWGLHTFIQWT